MRRRRASVWKRSWPRRPGCAGCPRNLLSSLGMHFGGCHSSQTGRSYTGTRVAKKRVKRLCEENQPADASDYRVRKPESWWELSTRNCEASYFSLGPVSKTYRAVDSHMRYRLRRWLCNKHKVQGPGGKTFPERLGLLRLEARTANLPWAKA
jgi:RNA-directed DNA polymerase